MKYVYSICAIAVLLFLLPLGAGAVTVVADKHAYVSNETINFTVTNMNDGVAYSQKTTVYQFLQPGKESEFGNNNLTWPFAHRNDIFNMTNFNTTFNSVVIGHWWPPAKGGGYEQASWDGYSSDIVSLDGTKVVKDTWNRSFNYEFDQTGTYLSHWKATPAPGATIVTSVYWINGTKLSGPVNFTQNTSVWSINPALIHIDWYENSTPTANEWFTLDVNPSVLPSYIPGGSSSAGSGSESYSGSSSVIGTATTSSSGGSGSGSGSSGATSTPASPGGTATGAATPAGTPTAGSGNATAATTTPASGSPFAIAALGALGCAALLLAGRVRR
jgi:hypothetical protein